MIMYNFNYCLCYFFVIVYDVIIGLFYFFDNYMMLYCAYFIFLIIICDVFISFFNFVKYYI